MRIPSRSCSCQSAPQEPPDVEALRLIRKSEEAGVKGRVILDANTPLCHYSIPEGRRSAMFEREKESAREREDLSWR
jgi:hypothetical protein